MKIKLLKNLIGQKLSKDAKAVMPKGTVIVVDDEIGKALIKRELAEEAKGRAAAEEPPKP
jgi:hypothetical protein